MAPVSGIINIFLMFISISCAIRHFVSSAKMKGIANLIHSGRSLIKMMIDKDDEKQGSQYTTL